MKVLVISDVHANIYALEAIWKREKDSDAVYCAGDLVDYGPYPREVIAWMRERRAVCVAGNHDEYVVALYRDRDGLLQVPDEEKRWAHDNALKLSDEDISYLENLPECERFELDGVAYCMQHLYENYETIASLFHFNAFWERQCGAPAERTVERRLIFGHTHRRAVHCLGDRELWLNPGSVSYRRSDDPTKEAHYITVTNTRIALKSVEYDRRALWSAALNAKLMPSEVETAKRSFACGESSSASRSGAEAAANPERGDAL